MKTLLFAVMLCAGSILTAQQPVNVAFDLTSGDTAHQETTLRHLLFVSEAYPSASFQLVLYGKAYAMTLADTSPFIEEIETLTSRKNVTITLCEGSMKRHKVTSDMLLPGIQTVPDGIMELAMKQHMGWGYIKEGN